MNLPIYTLIESHKFAVETRKTLTIHVNILQFFYWNYFRIGKSSIKLCMLSIKN